MSHFTRAKPEDDSRQVKPRLQRHEQGNPQSEHLNGSSVPLSWEPEANEMRRQDSKQDKEPTVRSWASMWHTSIAPLLAVLQWWFFNVVTVILNKYIFQELKFMFPLTLSTIHFMISSLGAYVCLKILQLRPLVEVKSEDRWSRIFPMAFVFTLNIVLGNISLSFIPVSFMQTVKSLTPATTVILQRVVWGRRFDYRVYLSLLPVVGGIALTSMTEMSFVWSGFLAALVGCFVTSTKTILAELLLSGVYSFDSLNTVYYMAPYASLILFLPALILEGHTMLEWWVKQPAILNPTAILIASGFLAFSLNYSIFYVIKTTSALTFNVAGNMKTAVAIFSSWWLFRNPMNLMNVLGCTITFVGCTVYGYVRQALGSKAVIDITQEPRLPVVAEEVPLKSAAAA